jgi:hypothetical protein
LRTSIMTCLARVGRASPSAKEPAPSEAFADLHKWARSIYKRAGGL